MNILKYVYRKFSFLVPDYFYLLRRGKKLYGKDFCIRHPRTFNEKLNWLKLHYRRKEYTLMVDKYEAKQYVADIIGNEHIIPSYGIYEKFDDIDFDKLPSQFVIKCTHDSGGLVIVRDKNNFDKIAAKEKISKCQKANFYRIAREWPYKNVPHKILIEKYMENNGKDLVDYKFYCFNGEPKFLYVSEGLENHETAKISFLNLDWTFSPYERADFAPFKTLPEKPKHFEEMIEISRKLSNNIPFVRVDLYEIDNKVYFSELTFSPCGGFMEFKNSNQDYEVGRMLNINNLD